MINEIAMVLMFAALFILVITAVIVGSRMGKAKTRPAQETAEEPPREHPETQEPPPEEAPPMEVEQPSVSLEGFEEETSLYMPEPEFFEREQPADVPEPEAAEETVELHEPVVEYPEPEMESVPEIDEDEYGTSMPEAVLPEPVPLGEPQPEEPVVAELYEDTYREPDYFKDEDVIPIQGVTTCPHCGEEVPATLYCINCGKSLNE